MDHSMISGIPRTRTGLLTMLMMGTILQRITSKNSTAVIFPFVVVGWTNTNDFS